MVVARKKPVAPAAASRTNSTQALPRTTKGRSTLGTENGSSSSGKETSSVSSASSETKSKSKSKGKKSKSPSSPSLIDRLFLPILAAIFLYALAVCPSDTSNSHALCRSLSTYRRTILEPYVLPPLRAVVTHPAVQEQYYTHVAPHVHHAQEVAAPYVLQAQKIEAKARPHVVRVARATKSTAEKVWEGTLRPYYTRAVVPRYRMFIAPHLDKYTAVAHEYIHHLQPHIHAYSHLVKQKYHSIRPYFVNAYDAVYPHIHNAYTTARPHALNAWSRARPFLCKAWKYTLIQTRVALRVLGVQIHRAGREVGNARKQYVDPHVRQIWEKVVESSSSPHPSPTVEDTPETAESIPSPTAPSAGSGEPILAESTVPHKEANRAVPTPQESVPEAEVTPEATAVEEVEAAVSIAEASAGHASSVVAELEREVKSVLENGVTESITPTPSPTEEPAPIPTEEAESATTVAEPITKKVKSAASIISASASSIIYEPEVTVEAVPTSISFTEDEDDDDFLRDIGLSSASTTSSTTPIATGSPSPEFEQPSAEERLAQTAAKRADIVGRHTRWQAELDALVKEQEKSVKKAIEDVRERAVEELKDMEKGLRDTKGKLLSKDEVAKNKGTGKVGRGFIDTIQLEGEKLLKGLEGYVKKAVARSSGWKREAGSANGGGEEAVKEKEVKEKKRKEEEDKWVKVVDKVEERFGESVRKVQGEVHSWYVDKREGEVQEVLQSVAEIKALADKAQADIGLDYAWLDDVTYKDWQKYHDLMRTAESFDHIARSLQNGTHTSSPTDPLITNLNNLEREMQDVIGGFRVRLQEIATDARAVFSPFTDGSEEPESIIGGAGETELSAGEEVEVREALAVEDEEYNLQEVDITQDDIAAGEFNFHESDIVQDDLATEPTYSILPIEGEDQGESENEEVVDAAKIIIGKDEKQVEAALSGVSVEPSRSAEELNRDEL
ncbi:hypothetical protein BDQ12DRAFT_681825 [Crucibulum laeve]|uniref:Transcription factor hoxa13 n=1 Tax=Crucibulum laeve TaxID=68775 RepID=A0A5C3M2S5_9AGAR|nr:hypothetical protein BDQ12DRAFT_681825 [Crucibulum laeve]